MMDLNEVFSTCLGWSVPSFWLDWVAGFLEAELRSFFKSFSIFERGQHDAASSFGQLCGGWEELIVGQAWSEEKQQYELTQERSLMSVRRLVLWALMSREKRTAVQSPFLYFLSYPQCTVKLLFSGMGTNGREAVENPSPQSLPAHGQQCHFVSEVN